jgi:hypothetical protein
MVDRPRTDDPDAPPSEEELAAAESLRAALERGEGPDAELLASIAAAARPRELSPEENAALVSRALERARRGGDGAPRPARGGGVVVRVAFGLAAAVAIAAGFAVTLRPIRPVADDRAAQRPPLVPLRSTQPLFEEPFQRGQTSARVDRIAMARASDLRENRYSRWGVR